MSSSLEQFQKIVLSKFAPRKRVLELGAGQKPLTLSELYRDLECYQLDKREGPDLNNYIKADFSVPFSLPQKFDWIIDAHLLHCLFESSDREQYFKNLRGLLTPGGICSLELMTHSKSIHSAEDFCIQNDVLFDFNGRPLRWCASSRSIEDLFLGMGFAIRYLYIHGNLKFIPPLGREEVRDYDPDCLRIVIEAV